MDNKLGQSKNAPYSIRVTLSGIITDVKLMQLRNIWWLIDFNVFDSLMDVKAPHP